MEKETTDKRVKIFLCYAHKDEDLREELEKHLQDLQRQGVLDLWDERHIPSGANRECEIDLHLDTAHIILLLVSPDFMTSPYC